MLLFKISIKKFKKKRFFESLKNLRKIIYYDTFQFIVFQSMIFFKGIFSYIY